MRLLLRAQGRRRRGAREEGEIGFAGKREFGEGAAGEFVEERIEDFVIFAHRDALVALGHAIERFAMRGNPFVEPMRAAQRRKRRQRLHEPRRELLDLGPFLIRDALLRRMRTRVICRRAQATASCALAKRVSARG